MAGDVSGAMSGLADQATGAVSSTATNASTMTENTATGAAVKSVGDATGASNIDSGTQTSSQAQTCQSTAYASGTATMASTVTAAGQTATAAALAEMNTLQSTANAAIAGGAIAPPESKISVPTAEAAYQRYMALQTRLAEQAAERAILRATYKAMLMDEQAKILAMNAVLEAEKMG